MKYVVNLLLVLVLVVSLFMAFNLVYSINVKPKETKDNQVQEVTEEITFKNNPIKYFLENENKLVLDNVDVTAYTSHAAQTDSTPFTAAWNNRLDPKEDKLKAIAASRDLLKNGLDFGDVVLVVKDNGETFTAIVKDKMNRRFEKRIDVYYGLDLDEAKKFGKQNWTIIYKK